MRGWLWQALLSFSWLIQRLYSEWNSSYYALPSLVQDTISCCFESIFLSDSSFECKWATNLFWWKLVDWWTRRAGFLRLGELREGERLNLGHNWLDEPLEAYLIFVSHLHGWISLSKEFWLLQSEADWRIWKIWSRDKRISYPANVDTFCARNNPVAEEVEPEYRFCVFVWVFLWKVIS